MSQDLVINDELVKAIQESLNPDMLKAAMAVEAEKQGLVRDPATGAYVKDPAVVAEETRKAAEAKAAEDKAAADKKAAEEAAVNASGFTKDVEIGGRTFTFEANTELELERMVSNALLVAQNVRQPEAEVVEETTQQTDPAKEAAARAELELKFKNGEINVTQYLEQSGAIDTYLQSKGLSINDIKEAVEETHSTKFEQSWADATQAFLNSPAGVDWPGGERNKQLIGMQIAAMGLVDSADKVQALAQAYSAMKSSGLLFQENSSDAVAAEKAAAEKAAAEAAAARVVATDAAAIAAAQKAAADAAAAKAAADAAAAAVRTQAARNSSSLFGASSGTGANDIKDKSASGQAVKVDPNASPEAILAAWNANLRNQGIDPNAAFMEAFSARKA